MKKSGVIFFLICIALGEWQQSGEIALPKGIQVNDLKISSSGELWLLSTSSILKYESTAENPFPIQQLKDGKLCAVRDPEVYIINRDNRLITLNVAKGGLAQHTELILNTPDQIDVAIANDKPFLIAQEPNQLTFYSDEKQSGSINTVVEKFGVVPSADYGDDQTPLYTLENNRIYAWTEGTMNNIAAYKKQLLYSASNRILDFTTAPNGDVFVLFADSVVVVGSKGKYKSKAAIENLPIGSKILVNPVNNNILIFNRGQKALKILSGINTSKATETIVLNSNRPNPVDNYTEIEFTINQPLNLSITIYNLIGEPVKVIARGHYPKGIHRITWRADDESGNLVPNGIYFYRLESKKGVAIRQLIVLR
jgi:hypothetical protein